MSSRSSAPQPIFWSPRGTLDMHKCAIMTDSGTAGRWHSRRPLTYSPDLTGRQAVSDRTCSIEGCEKPLIAWGWCDMHYRRWKKSGDPGPAHSLPRPGRICSVDSCERPVRAREWCNAHYQRWQKYGDPLADHRVTRQPCSIDDCDRLSRARGWCDLHFDRWRRNGDPLLVRPAAFPRGPEHPDWIGDRVGYAGMHYRLARMLGAASAHACLDCSAPGAEWSYTGEDPAEVTDQRRPDAGPYSTDPAFYIPRCISCHRCFDARRKAAVS